MSVLFQSKNAEIQRLLADPEVLEAIQRIDQQLCDQGDRQTQRSDQITSGYHFLYVRPKFKASVEQLN